MNTNNLKCKDEIIYRKKQDRLGELLYIWDYGIVTYKKGNVVHLVGGIYIDTLGYDILPFEGNEDLVGTNDSPDEEFQLKEGEHLLALQGFNTNTIKDPSYYTVIVYKRVSTTCSDNTYRIVDDKGCLWSIVVRFRDFNPNNMEETKKKLLCVKNGKVVRYKD